MKGSSQLTWCASNTVGICAFPLSKGHDTGRGLERVIAELVAAVERIGQAHTFYDRGIVRNEFAAVGLAGRYYLDLLRRRQDVWFAVYPVAGIFPILARKRPTVTGVYDLIPFLSPGYDNALKYFIKRRCIEFACRFSDGLIVPFSSTAKHITKMFGVAPDRIEVIPLGIDHTRFFLDQNIPKRKMRIGFLGEAKRAKGLDTAIIAFAQVARLIPEAFLVIASDGNEIEDMRQLAREMIPAEKYEFVGFVPEADMRRFYSELDLFLFPSRYGFGMSPVEAAACGTPAIVARTLDATDFFTNEISLVDPNSAEELAQRMLLLLTDRGKYDALRAWGLASVQPLSWDRMAERYIEFWARVRERVGQSTRRT
jgi:glycosyltransferase involved in cell wall biosynthesis